MDSVIHFFHLLYSIVFLASKVSAYVELYHFYDAFLILATTNQQLSHDNSYHVS